MLWPLRQPANKQTPNAKPKLYWCSDCRKYFSIRTKTAVAHTMFPLREGHRVVIRPYPASPSRLSKREAERPTASFMTLTNRACESRFGTGSSKEAYSRPLMFCCAAVRRLRLTQSE